LIEQLLIGLQRAKHIARTEMIQLQARYLHETTLWPSIRLATLKRVGIWGIWQVARMSE